MTSPSSSASSCTTGATREIKDQWRRGKRADAAVALAEHPELRDDKAAALDLAYEEFWIRRRTSGALYAVER